MTQYLNQKIAQADVPNRNKRVYSRAVLQAVIEDIRERNDRGMTLLGEFGHPTKEVTESNEDFHRRCAEIALAKSSHSVSNPRFEDGWLVADIESLNTPLGQSLDQIQKQMPIDFRMRGFSEMEPRDDGNTYITYYSFVTIDAVANGA